MFRRLLRIEPRTPEQVSDEIHDEIDSHIALGVEHLVARGVSPEDALTQMKARFGRPRAQVEASARRRTSIVRRREVFRTFGRDLIFAFRQARRAPLFSLGIVLSLGFGIGATATVYSWMQGLVLRPLPAVQDVDRLISVRPDRAHGFGSSLPEFEEWRSQSRTTSGLAAVGMSLFAFDERVSGDNARATPMYGMFVSANYFEVLGVSAGHGRLFTATDDELGAEPVAVVSEYVWHTRFNSDPAIVGRTVRLNNKPVRIIGVAGGDFGGNLSAARFDIFVPVATRPYFVPSEASRWRRRDWQWVDVLGRLKEGATIAQADDEFRSIASWQAANFVEDAERSTRTTALDMGNGEALGPLFVALTALTLLVVLLICSNVANLLLTRATTRDRELAVRLSLGAGRSRIIAQLMTESAGLAIVGAILGVLMALGGDNALGTLIPHTSIRLAAKAPMDWRFIMVVVSVTGGSVVAFGLAPAIIGSRVAVVEALKNGARGTAESRAPLRNTLVVMQFAFALVTLVSAALFFKHDRDVRSLDLGFDPDNVLLVQTEISLAGHEDEGRWTRTLEDAAASARRIPGVRASTFSSFVPLGLIGYYRNNIRVAGHPSSSGPPGLEYVNAVGPGYFDVTGIRILEGRPITEADQPDSPRAAVVNAAFVKKYFDGRAALGATFRMSDRDHVIVGIAQNTHFDYRAVEDVLPMVYYAWKQSPMPFAAIQIRTQGDPVASSNALLAAIKEVDPTLPTLPPSTLTEYIGFPFTVSRSIVKVAGTLSTVALILATMGLFSVISYGVTLRTREIGIRMALGASSGSVVSMFLGGAARLIVLGTMAGIIGSVALTTAMRTTLTQLPTGTLVDFLVPAAILAVSAFAAGFIPSRRAATIDPARTLRSE